MNFYVVEFLVKYEAGITDIVRDYFERKADAEQWRERIPAVYGDELKSIPVLKVNMDLV